MEYELEKEGKDYFLTWNGERILKVLPGHIIDAEQVLDILISYSDIKDEGEDEDEEDNDLEDEG